LGYFILILTIVVYILRPAEWIPALYFNWNMLLIALGAIVVFASFLDKNRKSQFDRTTAYLTWFFVAMILSNIFRLQFSTIGEYIPQILTNIIVFALVQITITDIAKLRRLINIVIFLLVFICYQCYLQVSVGFNWGGLEPMYRDVVQVTDAGIIRGVEPQVVWFGILNDPNDLGMLLVAFIPFILNRIFFQTINLIPKITWIIIAFILIYTLILTNSRGSMLGLIVGIGAFFIIKQRSLLGVIIAVLAALVILAVGPSRMAEMSSGDYSAMGRVEAWIESLRLFAMNPIFGIGANHFLDYHGRTAHNSYVLAFVETGFLGFFGYLSVFVLSVGTAIKVAFLEENKQKSIEIIALASGLIGLLITIFFISRTYILLPFFYASILITFTKIQSPELFSKQINATKIHMLALYTILFIIFVYLFNRLTTMLLL